jgi:hypothetical protein
VVGFVCGVGGVSAVNEAEIGGYLQGVFPRLDYCIPSLSRYGIDKGPWATYIVECVRVGGGIALEEYTGDR